MSLGSFEKKKLLTPCEHKAAATAAEESYVRYLQQFKKIEGKKNHILGGNVNGSKTTGNQNCCKLKNTGNLKNYISPNFAGSAQKENNFFLTMANQWICFLIIKVLTLLNKSIKSTVLSVLSMQENM